MAAALSNWRRRRVILVGTAADSRILRPIAQRGAQVASIRLLADTLELTVVVDGMSRPVREIRRRLAGGPRVLAVRSGGTDACRLAGVQLHACLGPALEAAVSLLRGAGLTAAQAWHVVDGYVHFELRAFRKAGRRSARFTSTEAERSDLAAQLESLASLDRGSLRVVQQALGVPSRSSHRADNKSYGS
jgi:hypothetical protein